MRRKKTCPVCDGRLVRDRNAEDENKRDVYICVECGHIEVDIYDSE